MISRAAVVEETRRWIGTPWHHQASVRGIGCDCIGLVVGVAAAVGVREAEFWRADVKYRAYGPLPLPDKLLAACSEYLDSIPVSSARRGDVLLMTFMKEPMHFGILTEDEPQYMAHGYQRFGQVREHALDKIWRRRVLMAFQLRGVG